MKGFRRRVENSKFKAFEIVEYTTGDQSSVIQALTINCS